MNNLTLGDIPLELRNLTYIEEMLIARHRPKCNIFTIDTTLGNASQSKIKGNIVTYTQNIDNLLIILPKSIQTEEIRIIFTGNKNRYMPFIKSIFKVKFKKIIKFEHKC